MVPFIKYCHIVNTQSGESSTGQISLMMLGLPVRIFVTQNGMSFLNRAEVYNRNLTYLFFNEAHVLFFSN